MLRPSVPVLIIGVLVAGFLASGCMTLDEPAAVGEWSGVGEPVLGSWTYDLTFANGTSQVVEVELPVRPARLYGYDLLEGHVRYDVDEIVALWHGPFPVGLNLSEENTVYGIFSSSRSRLATVQTPLLPWIVAEREYWPTLPGAWDLEGMQTTLLEQERQAARTIVLQPIGGSDMRLEYTWGSAPFPEHIVTECRADRVCPFKEATWRLREWTEDGRPEHVDLPPLFDPLAAAPAQPAPPMEPGGLVMGLPATLDAAARENAEVREIMGGPWGVRLASFDGRPLIGRAEWQVQLIDWDRRQILEVTIEQTTPGSTGSVTVAVGATGPLEANMTEEGLKHQTLAPLGDVPFYPAGCPTPHEATQIVRATYHAQVDWERTSDGLRSVGLLTAVESGIGWPCAEYESITSIGANGATLLAFGNSRWAV